MVTKWVSWGSGYNWSEQQTSWKLYAHFFWPFLIVPLTFTSTWYHIFLDVINIQFLLFIEFQILWNWWTILTDDSLWDESWLYSVQYCLKISKSRPSNIRLWPCHLCTEISSDSLNPLMILWPVSYEIIQWILKLSEISW